MPSRCRTFRPVVEMLESRDVPSTQLVAPDPTVPVPAPVGAWVRQHQFFSNLAKNGHANLLFLGDSITAHWLTVGRASWTRYFSPQGAYDFGISGDATQNLLWRITHGELNGIQPRVVVLMIGTNNLETSPPGAIVSAIASATQVIHTYLPNSKVLLLGILPRGGPLDTNLRAEISAINGQLFKLSSHNVRFLDVGSLFVGPDGTPRAELMPDALHLSAGGYRVMAQAINPAVRQLLLSTARPARTPAPAPAPAPTVPTTSPPSSNTQNIATINAANPQQTISGNPMPATGGNWFDGNAASQVWTQMGGAGYY